MSDGVVVEVRGTAVWRTREKPPMAIVESRLARGTSLLTRMQVEVADRAARAAGLDPAAVATVFGSWHGEMEIAIEQLGVIHRGDGLMSPARFRNSVHNTGSGVFTIAAKNRGFTTAIAAGPRTFAMMLLEAFGLVAEGAGAVVLAVADEPLPSPLDAVSPHPPLGVGLALVVRGSDTERTGRHGSVSSVSSLRGLRIGDVAAEVAQEWRGSAAGPALALVDAIAAGRRGTLGLVVAPEAGDAWCLDVG